MISNFQDRRTATSPAQLPPCASSRESRPSLPRAGGEPNPSPAIFYGGAHTLSSGQRGSVQDGVVISKLARLILNVPPPSWKRRLRLTALSWLALLGVSAFAPEVEAQSRKTQEILLISAAVADLATTEYLLHRAAHDPSVTFNEGNPLLANRGVRIAGKAAATFVILTLARKLESDGHAKAAKIARLATVAGWAGAAGWNVSLSIRY